MKKRKPLFRFVFIGVFIVFFGCKDQGNKTVLDKKIPENILQEKKKKKTITEQRLYSEERLKHEFNLQVNPKTGKIPIKEKQQEIIDSRNISEISFQKQSKSFSSSFISRGPSNLGGRTRSIVIDRSDPTSNTIISGGVTSGVFRTINGGNNWVKVSPNDQIHNVTTIVQDPRTGFENVWYYGTGELFPTSASIGAVGNATLLGQGIWESTDGGISWNQIPSTASVQEEDDSPFDQIYKIAVHPVTGELFAATRGSVRRFDGTSWVSEIDSGTQAITDLVITNSGMVYASFAPSSGINFDGVWQSPTGNGSWTRIGSNATTGFGSTGRMVLAVAPSNENIIYAFYTASSGLVEAGLWRWDNDGAGSWQNYSGKMPDEPGGDLSGNDPIAVQLGYDLVVSVKPDDENFVVIGGTNAYKIENIITDPTFIRIGGYRDNQSYDFYDLGVNGDEHHADIHALVFDLNNTNVLFSGTDGGVHKTNNVTSPIPSWVNLNNNYQTYQYFHVAIDPAESDIVLGGAQDNGTTTGGTNVGRPDLTSMLNFFGGDGVAVAISRDNDCTPFFFGVQNGRIFRDCPGSAQEITPDMSDSQFVTYFYLDPSNNNALYYAGETNLYRTAESSSVTSSTWSNLGFFNIITTASESNEFIRQMAATWGDYDQNTSYLLIGGDRGSLVRLDDPQNTVSFFAANSVDITPPNASGVVSGIAIHPNDQDIVMVTYSNYGVTNIFVTDNATSNNPTWEVVERNLNSFSIRSASITEVDGETRYFVGTARGLYSSSDPRVEDWVIESPDQIGFAVVSALAYRPSDNKLLVGTFGNGMFEATLNPVLSVEEFNQSPNDFVVYPNPADNELNIELEDTFVTGDLTYTIFNMTGEVLETDFLNDQKKIAVGNLATGNYILQLASSKRQKSVVFHKK